MKKITKDIAVHVFLPVCVGAFIYILFRKESLTVFLWFDKVSLLDTVMSLRDVVIGFKDKMPIIILYSLPDGIWVYSATYLMLIIWKGNMKNITALFWISAPLFLSIETELLQSIHIVQGSFCLYDMAFYIIGFILPVTIFRRHYANPKVII
ncbi:MAG: hypothetical protein KKI12_10045 [Proteobacteria bacterium]|nr:hypothetical protein [Pseudomonadota bacterium]MBU4258542.1 hypothetical protein [Pseudomonadota bacterium]MBU4288496.1 hypothetical protein [Pseudomonadota bacterium]MBU4414088.1 hypothetical protein [Pseudomonadota bacterium]